MSFPSGVLYGTFVRFYFYTRVGADGVLWRISFLTSLGSESRSIWPRPRTIGIVATIMVFGSAMLVKEAWRSCEFKQGS
jgi:hypothetical protein